MTLSQNSPAMRSSIFRRMTSCSTFSAAVRRMTMLGFVRYWNVVFKNSMLRSGTRSMSSKIKIIGGGFKRARSPNSRRLDKSAPCVLSYFCTYFAKSEVRKVACSDSCAGAGQGRRLHGRTGAPYTFPGPHCA